MFDDADGTIMYPGDYETDPPFGNTGYHIPSGSQYIKIDDMRLALGLQHYEEARAQYGSRYTEYLRYLGVRSSDARLQRPEYLGGGKQVIQWSEVLQTAPDSNDQGVGNLFGHGASALRTNRFVRFFEEHGIVLTLLSVVPVPMYVDGIARKFYRQIKEDYFQKELAMIGEQPVYNRELQGPACTSPSDVFGYQERYQEYRSNLSRISGEMATLYNHWHLGREFSGDVALNATFVDSNPSHRIFADQVNDSLLVMANHHIRARRMVGRPGTPKIV